VALAPELVCTADIDRRSSCSTCCGDCGYLITNRRRDRTPWWHWTFNERRVASNWIPERPRLGDGVLAANPARKGSGFFLWTLMGLLLAFNILDAVLTARALSLGFAEANPVLAGLFHVSVPMGMSFKFGIVAAGAYALWRFRDAALAKRGMAVLTGCYGAVIIYHLAFQLTL
jgi:hypothetical protein